MHITKVLLIFATSVALVMKSSAGQLETAQYRCTGRLRTHYRNNALHWAMYYLTFFLKLVLCITRTFYVLGISFSKFSRRTVPENFHYYVSCTVHAVLTLTLIASGRPMLTRT